MARCPLLYVHGNHDTSYNQVPPEGCDCIDDHIVTYNGRAHSGSGGCRKYHPGPHQYTDGQMRRRIQKLKWKLKRMGGVDIVVTHAPPYGLGDGDDPAHWGFESLVELLDTYHPPVPCPRACPHTLRRTGTGAGLQRHDPHQRHRTLYL